MERFIPISALAGGLLIGAAAALMLLLKGRIAGISGILGGLIDSLFGPSHGDTSWRALFLIGMMAAPLLVMSVRGDIPEIKAEVSLPMLVLAGLLVGFGTRLGSGCTSGHGVCGLGRRSARSLAATLTFMLTGATTVFVLRHVLGGRP
jgi:hypothetical protein